MIHLWATAGSGTYPVCGTPAQKGEVTYSVFYKDLCRACLARQQAKSLIMRRQQADRRKKREQDGEA